MSLTFTARLSKDAHKHQSAEFTIFYIKFGKPYKDRSGNRAWTNYTAAVFAKSEKQVAYYESMLVENNIVEISAKNLRPDNYEGYLTIELLDANLEDVFKSAERPSAGAAPKNQAPAPRNQPPEYSPQPDAGAGGFNQGQMNQNAQQSVNNQSLPQGNQYAQNPVNILPAGDKFDDDIPF